MTDDTSSAPVHTSPLRHVSWLTIGLALLAVISFFAISGPDIRYYGSYGITEVSYPTDSVPPTMPIKGVVMDQGSVSSAPGRAWDMMGTGAYYPYPAPNVPATDTRELLKVYYNASMRTRDAQGLTRRVETTVRGYDGRIDQISSSPKSGYVSFVVPASKYDAFRTELESLVGSRFLTTDIQSQNMLPQKQSIEEQQKQADTTLAEYKAARQNLVSAHASTAKSLQARIDADTEELARLRAQTPTYDIQVQIQAVSDELASLKAQLTNENVSYATQLKNADANIKNAQDWQTAVQKQDTALMDDVATVNGTVSIRWISLWEMAQLYLPGYWIPAIFATLAFLSYLWDRRRFGVV